MAAFGYGWYSVRSQAASSDNRDPLSSADPVKVSPRLTVSLSGLLLRGRLPRALRRTGADVRFDDGADTSRASGQRRAR